MILSLQLVEGALEIGSRAQLYRCKSSSRSFPRATTSIQAQMEVFSLQDELTNLTTTSAADYDFPNEVDVERMDSNEINATLNGSCALSRLETEWQRGILMRVYTG